MGQSKERFMRILKALDQVAAEADANAAEVALAWLITRKGVTAPIASATNSGQLNSLIRATQISLKPDQMAALEKASS